MSHHTDDREAIARLIVTNEVEQFGPGQAASRILASDWLKEHDAKVAADVREAGRVEGRNEVAASVLALATDWIKQRDKAVANRYDIPAYHWRGQDGEDLRAAVSDVGVDAHNRAVAETFEDELDDHIAESMKNPEYLAAHDRAVSEKAWDEGAEAVGDSWFDGSPGVVENPYRADATERGDS